MALLKTSKHVGLKFNKWLTQDVRINGFCKRRSERDFGERLICSPSHIKRNNTNYSCVALEPSTMGSFATTEYFDA